MISGYTRLSKIGCPKIIFVRQKENSPVMPNEVFIKFKSEIIFPQMER
jgi:hypothetical protein